MVEVKIKKSHSDKLNRDFDNVVIDCDGYEIRVFGLNREQIYLIKKSLESPLKFK